MTATLFVAALFATTAGAAPDCLQPVAADGDEPPCNPYLAGDVWSQSHRNSYAQGSSPYPGPEPGDQVRYEHQRGLLGAPVITNITDPYPDGGRAIWFSVVATPDGENVYKVDFDSGEVIDSLGNQDEGDISNPGTAGVSASGAYSILDSKNRLIVGRRTGLDVYRDAVVGDRFSDVAQIKEFVFPRRAFCGEEDGVVGAATLWDGTIAFATELGILGTVPGRPKEMKAENVQVLSLNGDRCAGATAADESLDVVSNSIAADEDGGIYPVTSQAMYKFRWNGESLERVWRARYEAGTGVSGVRLGVGSGSTPTLMGTADGDDRFVVFTDGQDLMHLVLMWRDRVPSDWRGLPGRDRRIACEIPVTFGDPDATESLSEQSVLVRGYGSVVVNNKLRNEDVLAGVPQGLRPVAAALAGQVPGNAPYGVERIDWDPRTRTCATTWVNEEISIPNAIPTMSVASGLVYGIGQRNGVWGLEGLDFETGASKLWIEASPDVTDNSAFAATTVGPKGVVFSGTFLGYTIFRPSQEKAGPDLLNLSGLKRCGRGSPRAIAGTDVGEKLTGSSSIDAILGRDGGDTLLGLRGDDCLYGERGRDLLRGSPGGDVIFGGADGDRLRGGAGDDLINGAGGGDRLNGGVGDDLLRGNRGPDTIIGGGGSDKLRDGGGSDELRCGPGRDTAILSVAGTAVHGCEKVIRPRS